ncbi:MAG: GDSL-type esterase/lipase family protein [Actinobacteria bacterium]|nr:GDSL-type esterase/lipase family protein [Actinomycetota bacterium]
MRAWAGTTLGRFLRRVVPGVHRVHAQVTPYATRWDAANELILTTTGPLWVVLGDSTAQGIGAPGYDQGYVGQLRILLDEQRGENGPWRVLNLSRSGARSADALESQLPRLESLPVEPDLVTCAIGANRWVGRQAVVLRDIPASAGATGMVRLDREEWRAESAMGSPRRWGWG